jgi:ribulose-5-phosphate 4-epimerase/fuculose-1-phosphate aldolase
MDTTATMNRHHEELYEVRGVRERVGDEEWRTRVDLAACYRLVYHYGWHHLHLNHISARVPGDDDHFLLNPFGLMYNEVTASNLVKVDLDGNVLDDTPYTINQAGYTIHSAVHGARKDVQCVLHTHTEAGMAISALNCGLLPLNQGALRFYNRIGYHDYEGIALDLDERERIVASLGPHKALILRNHGLLTAGASIAEAFVLMYHLEKSCNAQLMINATTPDSNVFTFPPPEVCEHAAQQANRNGRDHGAPSWPALVRMMDRLDPSYRN